MTELHPHWRSTGDQSDAPRTRNSGTHVKIEGQSVSRAPAAIVGILVVLATGFTLFRGWELIDFNVLGQAGGSASVSSSSSSSAGAMIRIAPNGIAPTSIVAAAGSLVTIVNNDSVPHIFTSKTLRDGSGKVLETPAIFAGTSYSFRIYADEVSGEHKISSTTTVNYVVTFMLVPAPKASSSAGAKPLGSLDDVPLPSGMGSRSSIATSTKSASSSAGPVATKPAASGSGTSSAGVAVASSSSIASSQAGISSSVSFSSASSAAVTSSSQAALSSESSAASVATVTQAFSSSSEPQTVVTNAMVADASGIPLNPFTVASHSGSSQPMHPAAQEKPKTTASTSGKNAAKTKSLHSGASLAKSNVKTGPETWIAVLGGLVGLVVVSRKHLTGFASKR